MKLDVIDICENPSSSAKKNCRILENVFFLILPLFITGSSRSPLSTTTAKSTQLFAKKSKPQETNKNSLTSHSNGFMPVWLFWCSSSSILLPNLDVHKLHGYGRLRSAARVLPEIMLFYGLRVKPLQPDLTVWADLYMIIIERIMVVVDLWAEIRLNIEVGHAEEHVCRRAHWNR